MDALTLILILTIYLAVGWSVIDVAIFLIVRPLIPWTRFFRSPEGGAVLRWIKREGKVRMMMEQDEQERKGP